MEIIRFAGLTLVIVCMYFSLYRFVINKGKRLARIPVIMLLVHFMIYYLTFIIGTYDQGSIPKIISSGDWTGILRLHAITTILSLEIYGYIRDKKGGHTWKT